MKTLRLLFLVVTVVLSGVSAGFAAQAYAQQPREKEEVLPLRGTEKLQADSSSIPTINVPVVPENVWVLDLSNGGRVRIQLRPDVAPQHVERIKTLTRQGFYNGLKFHRVLDGFMAQGGDPKNDGTGGSPLPDLKAEFNGLPHLRGTLSMARADDPNSANSQFFIMFLPRMALDRNYTVFGRVIEGMQYVDQITRGQPPANPTTIVQASIEADNKPKPTYVPPPAPAPVALPPRDTLELPAPAPAAAARAPAARVDGPAVPAKAAPAAPPRKPAAKK